MDFLPGLSKVLDEDCSHRGYCGGWHDHVKKTGGKYEWSRMYHYVGQPGAESPFLVGLALWAGQLGTRSCYTTLHYLRETVIV